MRTQFLKELERLLEHSVFGKPNKLPPCSRNRRHGGARVVQVLGPSLPRPAARRSRGGRVDSWLAITRVCCSRCPLVKGVHLPPLSTHHALPDISPTSPPDRRPLTQPKNSTSFFFFFRTATMGPLANRPIETTRDPNRNLCGSHLSAC